MFRKWDSGYTMPQELNILYSSCVQDKDLAAKGTETDHIPLISGDRLRLLKSTETDDILLFQDMNSGRTKPQELNIFLLCSGSWFDCSQYRN